MENQRFQKPLFSIDTTSNKKNEVINGAEFISATAPEDKVIEFEKKADSFSTTVDKAKLPFWLQMVEYICLGFGFMVLAGIIKADSFATAFNNAPILIISGLIALFIGIVVFIYEKVNAKKVIKTENLEEKSEKLEHEFKLLQLEMGVPMDVPFVDILLFKYVVKDGKVVPKAYGLQTSIYCVAQVRGFSTNNEVCFAEVDKVYSFDKSYIKGITTINKRISFTGWNKKESPTQGEYKKYKMSTTNMGDVLCKPYYVLDIEYNGELYGIYFPCYELETIENITGLKAN